MQNFLFLLLLLFLFSSFQNTQNAKVEREWQLRMINKIRWDVSKSYMGEYIRSASSLAIEKETSSGMQRASILGAIDTDAVKMSYFYGMDNANMLIRFKYTHAGAAYCEIGTIPDQVLHQSNDERKKWTVENCLYQASGGLRLIPFCPVTSLPDWRIANGTYIQPSKSPSCIYDFHKRARENSEYHLLSYCAKGYFYNGHDYTDEERNRALFALRKDWLLYLSEGKVTCGISGNVEEDQRILAKGYTVELVHYSSNYGDLFTATLAQYHDEDKEGRFMFAAMVGAGQLDAEIQWGDSRDKANLWDRKAYHDGYQKMSYLHQYFYFIYHNMLRRRNGEKLLDVGRYNLLLQITHYCTERQMRKQIRFDVAIGPEQVPGGIYEDTAIEINLNEGRMTRSTGQVLCAIENPSSPSSACTEPGDRPNYQITRGMVAGDKCKEKAYCPIGLTCRREDAFCKMCGRQTRCVERCRLSFKQLGHCAPLPAERQNPCKTDGDCGATEYCLYTTSKCIKMMTRGKGETCNVEEDCYGRLRCLGTCRDPKG